MAEQYDANMKALVTEEEKAAQALERRAAEVKSVKDEMSALVQQADELYGKGPMKIMASFDVVSVSE